MKPLLQTYLLVLLLLVVLPLNGFTNTALHTTIVVSIRLDYLLHVLLLLPWLFLTVSAWNRRVLPLLFLGAGVAVLLESIQYFLPYRSFNINDMLANMLGVGLGLTLLIPRVYLFLMRVSWLKRGL